MGALDLLGREHRHDRAAGLGKHQHPGPAGQPELLIRFLPGRIAHSFPVAEVGHFHFPWRRGPLARFSLALGEMGTGR